jgi:type I restriction enzyme, S subunit
VPTIRKEIMRKSSMTTRALTNGRFLSDVDFAYPNLDEQSQIVAVLETWDKFLESLGKKIEYKKKVKKGLMQQMLSGKKRLSGFNKPWAQIQIGDLGNIVTGSTPPKDDTANYDGQYYWATAEDFNGKYISSTRVTLSDKGKQKSRTIKEGSILVTCIASIGKNAIVTRSMSMNQQINAIEVNETFDNEFFYYLIGFSKNNLLKAAGAGAMPMLSKSEFSKVKLYAPTEKTEQHAIASILSAADNEIVLLEEEFLQVSKQGKYLMNNLVSGRINATENIHAVKEAHDA